MTCAQPFKGQTKLSCKNPVFGRLLCTYVPATQKPPSGSVGSARYEPSVQYQPGLHSPVGALSPGLAQYEPGVQSVHAS